MITVFKYIIPPEGGGILLPTGAETLSVSFQDDDLYMWVKVDTDVSVEPRNFEVFGTGHEIPYNIGVDYKFIGTSRTNSGLVFHVFERFGL